MGLSKGLRGVTLDITPLKESRDLSLLFGGQAINALGSQIRIVTVPYLVYVETHSSLIVGLLSLAQFGPALLCSILGGTLADVMDRRRLLTATQFLLAICSGALATAALAGWTPVWFIFVVLMTSGGIGAIDQPTRRVALTRLVSRDQLANGLALNQIIGQTGSVLGPTLAGFAIATVGVGPALIIDTATFSVSLISIWLMKPMPVLAGTTTSRNPLAATKEGLVFLKGRPVILSTFLIDINATLFGAPTALFPALALDVFKVGPSGLGFLYAAPAAGAMTGALFSGWVGKVRRQGRAVVIFVCIWGLAIAAFGLLAHAFWLALVMLAIAYAADQYSAIFRSTILQLAVPDHLRGRLSAIHFLVVTSGPRFGNFESGALAAATSTEFSVVSGGIAAFAGAIIVGLAIPAFMRYDALSEADPDEHQVTAPPTLVDGEVAPGDRAPDAQDQEKSAAVSSR